MSTLSLESVGKTWRGATDPVLSDVCLTVPAGSVVGVRGANGSGKTTLARIAAGLIAPDAGRVTLDGETPEADWKSYQRKIGFLAAGSSGLYARLSAKQHLSYWAALSMMGRSDRRTAVPAAIERFELARFADRRVDRISLGQRQRVRLAMTFLHRPALVLLDEPASSLDEEGLALLMGVVDDLRTEGGSAVWCAPAETTGTLRLDARYQIADGVLEGM